MRAALDYFAPPMREALVLVAVQNLTNEEAAIVMGCRVGTVKSRVWRGRERLVRVLGHEEDGIGPDPIVLSVMTETR